MLIKEWVPPTLGQNWQYFYSENHLCPLQWHYHPEFELTLTRNARGIRHIGGDSSQFNELDLAIIAPNQPHTWQAEYTGKHQQVQVAFFTLTWLETLVQQGMPELRPLCLWLSQIQQGIIFSPVITNKLEAHFSELHELRGLPRLMCLLDILQQLQNDHEMRVLTSPLLKQQGDIRLAAALNFMQQHYTEVITLDDLARVAKSSKATIKRLLNVQMNTHFSALLAQLRINHACNLLSSSQLSIPILAQQSGFLSLSMFYRKFSELKDCTPKIYRNTFSQTKSKNKLTLP